MSLLQQVVSYLVCELPKSTLPAGSAIVGGQYVFYVSGPTPLRCDYACRNGDALILSTGGNAAVHFGEGRFSYSTDCWALEPIDGKVEGKFLYYHLSSQIARIDALGFEGSGLRHLRKNFIRCYPVPEFPLCEQTKIAEVLSTVDRAIEQTEALIAKQQRIKSGLMQDLLTRGIDERGNLRSEETHQFKDSPLGRIPVEWDPKHLREVADYQNGKAFPSTAYCDSGVRLVRPGNLAPNGWVVWDDAHTTHLPVAFWEKARDYQVGPGEILMNLTAQSLEDQFLGRVCMTPEGNSCLLNQRIARIIPYSCDPSFLFWSLKGPHFRDYVNSIPQGTKVQHVYNRNIDAVQLAIPKSNTEQESIASTLWGIEKKTDAFLKQLEKIKSLKTALMQDLLTGKVRVTPLLKESQEAIA